MATFSTFPFPPLLYPATPVAPRQLPSPLPTSLFNSKFKVSDCGGRVLVVPPNCLPDPIRDAEPSDEDGQTASSSSSSTYALCAGFGGLGFLETSYLTYLKLSNSEAFCPVAGGACSDVLNSKYSVVFGVPLPLFGMVAYGSVLVLGLKLAGGNLPFRIKGSDSRLILFSVTASMAAASSYFLYTLSTQLAGASCSYCYASAALSLSLFIITLKDLGWQNIQKALAVPLISVSLVLALLSNAYSYSQAVPPSSAEVDFPYYTTEITTESSPLAISLARHLHSIGAKMYGAFWCSHCLEQKEMFGREAAKLLDYVECFPAGYRKGVKIEKACSDARIEGFPTWVINGKVLSGDQELEELAQVSGFQTDKVVQ
ncbi:hypothetical protein V2J09_021505 [Rumex salicifolius]